MKSARRNKIKIPSIPTMQMDPLGITPSTRQGYHQLYILKFVKWTGEVNSSFWVRLYCFFIFSHLLDIKNFFVELSF